MYIQLIPTACPTAFVAKGYRPHGRCVGPDPGRARDRHGAGAVAESRRARSLGPGGAVAGRLDYLDTRTEGLALVSAEVQSIRITEGTKVGVVCVSRHVPGPGVAMWPAGYDGNETVDGLDSSGSVIATAPTPS